MRIRKGQLTCRVPDCSSVVSVIADYGKNFVYMVSVVPVEKIYEFRARQHGLDGNVLYASIPVDNVMQLYPKPDRDFDLRVRYAPPLLEV